MNSVDAGLTSLPSFDGDVKTQDGNSEELLSQELFVNDGNSNSAEEDSDDDEIMTHRIHKTKSKKMFDSDDDDDDDVSVKQDETVPSSDLFENKEVNQSTSILIEDSENSDKNDTVIEIEDSDGSSKRDMTVMIEDYDNSSQENGSGNINGEKTRIVDNDNDESGDESSSDDSSSSDENDDDPPLRLFRSKEASDRNGGPDEDEFEREVSGIASGEHTAEPKLKQKRKPSRENVLVSLKSETQRLIRESRVNLPYHVPENLKFEDFMANRKKLKEEPKNTLSGASGSINKPAVINKPATNNNEVIVLTDGDTEEPTKSADVVETVPLNRKLTRRERIENLLKSQGRTLPPLNVPTLKQHPTGRAEAAAHQSIELGSQKVLPNHVQSFKNRFLSQIRKPGKTEESEKPTKLAVSSSNNKRIKEREKLMLAMKAKREAERLRKEELRRLDNEEMGDEEEEVIEDPEAEMTDYEEDEDVEDTNSALDDQQSNHFAEEQAACSDDDVVNIEDDGDDKVEKEDTIVNIDDEDDDKISKDDVNSDFSSNVLPSKDLLVSDSSNKSDHSAQLFNQSSKKSSTDEEDSSSLPLCQKVVCSSPRRSVPKDECSFFDKSNGASDSFMATSIANDSLPMFTSQGLFNDSGSEKTIPTTTTELVQLEAEDNNANDGQKMLHPDLFDVLCSGKFPTQAKDNAATADDDANDGRNFFAKVDESSSNNHNVEADEDSQPPKTKFIRDTAFMSPIPPSRKLPPSYQVTPVPDRKPEQQDEEEDDEVKVSKKKRPTRLLFDEDEKEQPAASEGNSSENRTEYFGTNFQKLDYDDNDEEEDDESLVIVRKKKESDSPKNYFEENKEKPEKVENFLEAEAELSGDDDGEEDGEDGENIDYYEEDEDNGEVLPDEEALHQQVNKAHQKQVLDADKRQIELLQEVYMPEDPIANRKRRYRWNNDSEFTQGLLDDAEDEDAADDEDDFDLEGSERAARLEKEEFLSRLMPETEDLIDEESRVTRLGKMKIENSRSRLDSQFSLRSSQSDSMPVFPSSRSNSSLMFPKLEGSFLHRDQSFHARVAKLPDFQSGKSVVNSDKMIFRRRIDDKKTKLIPKKRVSLMSSEPLAAKRPRELDINENSNSVFDMF